MSIRATIQDETTNIEEYIRKMPPMMTCKLHASGSRNPVRRRKKKREPSWRDKPLHRLYHQQIEEVADIDMHMTHRH